MTDVEINRGKHVGKKVRERKKGKERRETRKIEHGSINANE